jgi:hypothetical protein
VRDNRGDTGIPFVRESEERKYTMTKDEAAVFKSDAFCDGIMLLVTERISGQEADDALFCAWAAAKEHRQVLQEHLEEMPERLDRAEKLLAAFGPEREIISRWWELELDNIPLFCDWAVAKEQLRVLREKRDELLEQLDRTEKLLSALGPEREIISRWGGRKLLADEGLNDEQILSGYGELWNMGRRTRRP